MSQSSQFTTHEVFNQSPPFEDVNLFTSDRALREVAIREGGGGAEQMLTAYGSFAGSALGQHMARLANEEPPRLRTFDSKGRRLDVVEYHPAYHDIMRESVRAGLHCLSWDLPPDGGDPYPGRNVARAGLLHMAAQLEPGHCCPLTMTNAGVATLLLAPSIAESWVPLLLSRHYDPAFLPAHEKAGLTLGMGMTEKQGGTDVRANTTRADPIGPGGPEEGYLIVGHKWFLSAPMSDAFLVLAQAPGGLSCFFMPRVLPDGSVNPIRIQRLKDKLGNRSNASAEVEFAGCRAWLVGEEGRGIATIMDMVTFTRLDCAVSSAGLMRSALANALHHTAHRAAFQRRLIDQPLMRQVLADLALDSEAATALAFRLARAFDEAGAVPAEAAFRRVMTPVIKYWVCKTCPGFVYEAMECLGGNGYVEEGPAARLYREAPVNAIWEGSGNVMCLDVARVAERDPDAMASVMEQLGEHCRGDKALEAAFEDLRGRMAGLAGDQSVLRGLVERLALLWAAGLLRASDSVEVADAFIASRIAGGFRSGYGAGPKLDDAAILERAAPVE